ncbi:neurturin [Colossoma macropomum]|uniref:neurturin n=1 Tax=Colossoma macropomum TaxID=42526 RepID=UPI001864D106|nr:neurturin [Colossoma macropomum]XP_036412242.1 neurturin [Colossoma macropomum]
MKLWKGAILAFILISTAVLLRLNKTMLPPGSIKPRASEPSTHPSSAGLPPPPSAPPSSSSSSLHREKGLRRVVRSTDGMGSLLSEFSYLFQSFTEGELQRVIRMLVDRKTKRLGAVVVSGRGRRTKRARRGPNPCKLHQKQLRVSDLGLGYDSNEIVLFRYCSGKCTSRRRNYDMVLEHMRLNEPQNQKGKARSTESAKRDRARYSPCCRPTKYEEDMVFFDNNERFSIIQNVSASECRCV